MTINKIAIILSIIFSFTLNSYGQKIRYNDFKNDISTKNYRLSIKNPRYSPVFAGILNYLIPSSGYFYVGEPIRGACVLGSEIATISVFAYGLVMSMSVDTETGQSPEGARTIMFSGMIATGLIHIWSIYDVVKIAKIKNLAYQEKQLTIKLQPDFYIGTTVDIKTVNYGLKLTIDF